MGRGLEAALTKGGWVPTKLCSAGIKEHRGKLLGFLLAVPLLVFSILTGIGILATFLIMNSQGMPTSLGVELFFAVIIVVSLVLSVLYLREVK
jgi:hypothetical protein